MRRREPPGPTRLLIRDIAADEVLVVYRVVSVADMADPRFVDSFKSRGEVGSPPRRGTPEERHPDLNDGISTYLTRAEAEETARSVAKRGRSIGEYTARVSLRGGLGIRVASWGAHGHLTVWGDSLILSQAADDIVPVGG